MSDFETIEAKKGTIDETPVFFEKTSGKTGAVVNKEVFLNVEEVHQKIALLKVKVAKYQAKVDVLEKLLLQEDFVDTEE